MAQDSRFSPENFGKQPVWLILQALEQVDEWYRHDVNTRSMSVARVATAYAGMAFKHPDQIKESHFLPYDLKTADPNQINLSPQTATFFVQLIKSQRLPDKIISAASPFWQQLEQART